MSEQPRKIHVGDTFTSEQLIQMGVLGPEWKQLLSEPSPLPSPTMVCVAVNHEKGEATFAAPSHVNNLPPAGDEAK